MFEAMKEKRKIRQRETKLAQWSKSLRENPTPVTILDILSDKEALKHIQEHRYSDELLSWEHAELLNLPQFIVDTPFTLEEVKQISQNEDEYFAGLLFANEKLPAEAYVFLSEDADLDGKSYLAENPSVPVELLSSYVEEALAELRHKNHGSYYDYMGINLASNPSVPLSLLRKLGALTSPAEHPVWIKEMRKAGTPVDKKQSNASRAIWHQLSNNPAYTFITPGWQRKRAV